MNKFEQLGISPIVVKSLQLMGFEEPTPIQEETIPVISAGHDIIGQAQTGTGKTAAFGIPVIDKVDPKKKQVQALVLTPTRELAIQVSEELYKISKTKRLFVNPIYGGSDIQKQIRALQRGVHVVVGTPGRILDHLQRKTLNLSDLKFIILDEADEMLNMGFIQDIETILGMIPNEKQTLLFSATMPGPIKKISEQFMNEPKQIQIKAKELTVPLIDQFFVNVHEREKFDVLTRFIDIHAPELAIVFGRTKRRVDELSEGLQRRGYSAEGIHGDLTQAKRMSVLRKFKEGRIDILVATDVAARGLDISGVTHVYNFDIPQDPESYVHRIGRTGRAGKQGEAFLFVTPRERDQLRLIELTTKKRLERIMPPSESDVMAEQLKSIEGQLAAQIEEDNIAEYLDAARGLLEKDEAEKWLAAALKVLVRNPDETPIKLTEESPVYTSRSKLQKFNKSNGGGGNRNRDSRGRGGDRSKNFKGSSDKKKGSYSSQKNERSRKGKQRKEQRGSY